MAVVESEKRRMLLPTPSQATPTDVFNEPALSAGKTRDTETGNEEARTEGSAPVTKSRSCSHIPDWLGDTIADIPSTLGGAAFHRYILAEIFGASLIGSGVQRPRSVGLLCFRGYVAASQSDLVQATDDTVCLMLPGCKLPDPSILLDARKRHLVAVQCMQRTLEGNERDSHGEQYVLATITGAIELLFVDMFKPVSLGVGSLYGGLVHLVRTHVLTLVSSEAPVTGWLLIQLRQIMLIESLASGTALPIGTEIWKSIPYASTLIPETTETLMRLAVQLPGLVQNAHEAASSSNRDLCTMSDLLADLLTLERCLTQWQTEHLNQDGALQDGQLSFLRAQPQSMCHICLLLLQEAVAGLASAQSNDQLKHGYFEYATKTADTLCQLVDQFFEDADGMLSKALSVSAPLHFAHEWYETNADGERAACTKERMKRLQNEVPFLAWRSLVPLSLLSMYMNG